MKSIGKGKYIVVIISDKYLKSENCMFEILELKKKGSIYRRIFPIVLDDAKIYEETERIDYISYWDNKIDQLNSKIKNVAKVSGMAKSIEKIDQFVGIRGVMDELTDMLRNMNTLTPDVHLCTDFSLLIEAIENAQ